MKKWGVGCWKTITDRRVLPGKTVAQFYNQAQRLLGQQSLAEFQGLHLDLQAIFDKNSKIKGKRKNKCLINTQDKLKPAELKLRKEENERCFGLTEEQVKNIVIPNLDVADRTGVVIDQHVPSAGVSRLEKIQRLRRLYSLVAGVEAQLESLVSESGRDDGGSQRGEIGEKRKLVAAGIEGNISKHGKQSKT